MCVGSRARSLAILVHCCGLHAPLSRERRGLWLRGGAHPSLGSGKFSGRGVGGSGFASGLGGGTGHVPVVVAVAATVAQRLRVHVGRAAEHAAARAILLYGCALHAGELGRIVVRAEACACWSKRSSVLSGRHRAALSP